MITVTDRPDGTRKVSVTFPADEVVITRLSDDRKSSYEDFVSRSRTKPEFAKEVDLTRIMAKYDKTGIIDPILYRDMSYGDFSSGADLADSMIRVKDAEQEFSNLPAEIRNYFRNDPVQLVDFLADPANDEKSRELGLRDKLPPAPPVTPPATPPVVPVV